MDSINKPLISIIMPAHNAARFIRAAVQTVLDQTYPSWELLIIDDASTDETPDIIQSFTDSRIHYARVNRIGSPAGVRNAGLHLAKGELIAFLDADDLYYPDALERLSQTLIWDKHLTAAYGFAAFIDEHDAPVRQDIVLVPNSNQGPNTQPYQLPPNYPLNWERILTGQLSCLLPALMIRKSTLDRVGYFNEALCGPEDYEFYIRLYLDNFDGVACLPAYIYRYRVYAASLTKAPEHSERILNSALQIMDWLFTESKLPKSLHYLKSRAYITCYRYFARERLIHHQPEISRYLIFAALQNPHISFSDWLRHCLSLLVRSILPASFDSILIHLRGKLRNQYYRRRVQTIRAS